MILIFYFKIIQWRIKAMKIINIRLQLIEFLRINKLKTMWSVNLIKNNNNKKKEVFSFLLDERNKAILHL